MGVNVDFERYFHRLLSTEKPSTGHSYDPACLITVLEGRVIILQVAMEESLKRRQSSECSYQHDPYSWALEQARALRQRRAAELDWDNLAEEVEDLARGDAQALQSNCEVLMPTF